MRAAGFLRCARGRRAGEPRVPGRVLVTCLRRNQHSAACPGSPARRGQGAPRRAGGRAVAAALGRGAAPAIAAAAVTRALGGRCPTRRGSWTRSTMRSQPRCTSSTCPSAGPTTSTCPSWRRRARPRPASAAKQGPACGCDSTSMVAAAACAARGGGLRGTLAVQPTALDARVGVSAGVARRGGMSCAAPLARVAGRGSGAAHDGGAARAPVAGPSWRGAPARRCGRSRARAS